MAIENQKNRWSLDAGLRWIGDLDHPFYQDERQRFVWYEASAIGFQMILMLQFIVTGIAILVLGRDALLYTALGFVPVVLTAIVVVSYAHRRGAEYFVKSSDLRRSRGIVAGGIILLFLAGFVRIAVQGNPGESANGFWSGFGWSFAIGGTVGIVAAGAGIWLAKRKHLQSDE